MEVERRAALPIPRHSVPLSPPELLVAANRASTLETVLRWMLHDLRSPLQTLHFIPALQSAELESGDAPMWQEGLSSACERLSTGLAMVDRLVGSGAEPAEPEPVALGEILGFLADLFRARRGRLEMDFTVVRGTPMPAVSAVRRDLEAALLNLLLNSAEAAGNQATRVTAQVAVRSDVLELALEDDGPGIPPDLRPRLFEPFATARTDRPGRGLGLFAARHLLIGSGADLRHEPVDKGCRFVVRLEVWRA
jgi:C4-dicarboxylate-specific signal transduction histidine kinase